GNSIDNNAIGIYGAAATTNGQIDPAAGAYKYWNVPATRHNSGAVLSFADGHAEWWRWVDPWIVAAASMPDDVAEGMENAPARDIVPYPADRDLRRLKLTVPVKDR